MSFYIFLRLAVRVPVAMPSRRPQRRLDFTFDTTDNLDKHYQHRTNRYTVCAMNVLPTSIVLWLWSINVWCSFYILAESHHLNCDLYFISHQLRPLCASAISELSNHTWIDDAGRGKLKIHKDLPYLSNIPGVNGLQLLTKWLKSSNKLLDVSEPSGTTMRPRFLSGEEKVNSLGSAMAVEAGLFLLVEYLAVMATNLFSFPPFGVWRWGLIHLCVNFSSNTWRQLPMVRRSDILASFEFLLKKGLNRTIITIVDW